MKASAQNMAKASQSSKWCSIDHLFVLGDDQVMLVGPACGDRSAVLSLMESLRATVRRGPA